MRIINTDTTGLPQDGFNPEITQITVIDEDRNVLLSANIKPKHFNYESCVISGVPNCGLQWSQVLPLINQLIENQPVFLWCEDFDKKILELNGVDLSTCDNITYIREVSTVRYLPKYETALVKGYQTLGKCMSLHTLLLEEGLVPEEEVFNLDF